MLKRFSIFGILLIASILIIARSGSPKSVESKPVSRQHPDANGVEIPTSRNSRRRAPDLTPGSLCERLSKAQKIGASDDVFRKITSQLGELDGAQLIQMLDELKSASCEEKSKSSLELAIVG